MFMFSKKNRTKKIHLFSKNHFLENIFRVSKRAEMAIVYKLIDSFMKLVLHRKTNGLFNEIVNKFKLGKILFTFEMFQDFIFKKLLNLKYFIIIIKTGKI